VLRSVRVEYFEVVDLCFETDAERCANVSGAKLGVSSVSSARRYSFTAVCRTYVTYLEGERISVGF